MILGFFRSLKFQTSYICFRLWPTNHWWKWGYSTIKESGDSVLWVIRRTLSAIWKWGYLFNCLKDKTLLLIKCWTDWLIPEFKIQFISKYEKLFFSYLTKIKFLFQNYCANCGFSQIELNGIYYISPLFIGLKRSAAMVIFSGYF